MSTIAQKVKEWSSSVRGGNLSHALNRQTDHQLHQMRCEMIDLRWRATSRWEAQLAAAVIKMIDTEQRERMDLSR